MATVSKTTPSQPHRGNPSSGHVKMVESPLPYRQEDPMEADDPNLYSQEVGGVVPG